MAEIPELHGSATSTALHQTSSNVDVLIIGAGPSGYVGQCQLPFVTGLSC